jgi:hypothetical protein
MPQTEPDKSLSQKPLGYILAAAGGLIGGPIGVILSLLVLLALNNLMKEKEGKHPNRFLVWAAIGVIGAPVSLIPIIGSGGGDATTTTTKQAEPEMVAETQQQQEQQPTETRGRTGVNKENYLKLQNGMSYQDAVRILGEDGEEMTSSEIAGIRTEMYMWKAKGFSGGNMNATFQNGALVSKAQFNLD